MKNYKGNMLLIELVIVILFFALSQVVLVQVFAEAQRKTVHTSKLNKALITAQDIVEQLCNNPDPDVTLAQVGFVGGVAGSYVFSNQDGVDFFATISRLSQPQGEMVTVKLTAKLEDQALFTLPSVQYFATEVPHE